MKVFVYGRNDQFGDGRSFVCLGRYVLGHSITSSLFYKSSTPSAAVSTCGGGPPTDSWGSFVGHPDQRELRLCSSRRRRPL
ncbi:hypothetical protein J6590_026005 [Homalodisca vitripennis]|nr:hypothetical protein J6590_026005 [Homalodisca vitripennis]